MPASSAVRRAYGISAPWPDWLIWPIRASAVNSELDPSFTASVASRNVGPVMSVAALRRRSRSLSDNPASSGDLAERHAEMAPPDGSATEANDRMPAPTAEASAGHRATRASGVARELDTGPVASRAASSRLPSAVRVTPAAHPGTGNPLTVSSESVVPLSSSNATATRAPPNRSHRTDDASSSARPGSALRSIAASISARHRASRVAIADLSSNKREWTRSARRGVMASMRRTPVRASSLLRQVADILPMAPSGPSKGIAAVSSRESSGDFSGDGWA